MEDKGNNLEFKVRVPDNKNYAAVISEINEILPDHDISQGEYGQATHLFCFIIPSFEGNPDNIYKILAEKGYERFIGDKKWY